MLPNRNTSLQIPHLYILPVYVYEFLYSPLSWDYLKHTSQTFSLCSFQFSLLTRHWSQKDKDRSDLQHIVNLDLLISLGQGPPSCSVFVQHLHHWCPSQCLDAIMTQITTLFRTGVRAPANQRNHSGSLKNKSFHAAPGNASSKYLGSLCF